MQLLTLRSQLVSALVSLDLGLVRQSSFDVFLGRMAPGPEDFDCFCRRTLLKSRNEGFPNFGIIVFGLEVTFDTHLQVVNNNTVVQSDPTFCFMPLSRAY